MAIAMPYAAAPENVQPSRPRLREGRNGLNSGAAPTEVTLDHRQLNSHAFAPAQAMKRSPWGRGAASCGQADSTNEGIARNMQPRSSRQPDGQQE